MIKVLSILGLLIQISLAQQDYKKSFTNLPEKQRSAYILLIEDSDRLNEEKKIFSAYLKLCEAREIFTVDPSLKFREATFFATIGDVRQARKLYEEVLRIVPNDYHTLESLSELSYRNQQWMQCIKDIETFRDAYPERTAIYPLLSYKQLICLQKLGDHKQFHFYMQRFLRQFSYMDDTPMSYYLGALEHILDNDDEAALAEISTSWRVFGHPGLHKSWTDALIHANYIPESKLMMRMTKKYHYRDFSL